MVRMILPFATAVLTCSLTAQPPQRGMAFDDDGGRVETFRATDPVRALEYHGGAVLREPLVQVVFLGDWSRLSAEMRALRQRIERVPASELESAGIRRPVAPAGAREIVAGVSVNDLQVQAMLAAIALREENVVYVVFVAPTTHATIGGEDGFESYHSNVHADDVHIRYVVAPFRGDVNAAGEAAAKSLVRAIINPDGDGWY